MVGNIANFMGIDLFRCLLRIEKPVSRSFLSSSLGLGEGTVRSILGILKSRGYLESSNAGHYLSEKGRAIAGEIKSNMEMRQISRISMFPNKKVVAIKMRNPSKTVNVVALRDEAVKNGAEGAVILKYDRKLRFYDSDYKEDLGEMESKLELSENDFAIVACADSFKLAEYGAIAAAVRASNILKNTLKKLYPV